uniref:BAG domain-containing protein n=1 Tax=Trypanosoma congolense (strain IL3000) TaxID=1068625 RepID=G0UPM4_TRYCI|nr:conserved hypothetical protein [Trypanosoma congolense IL3000]
MHRTMASKVSLRLQSSRGEMIDLLLHADCTVQKVVDFLVKQYDYPEGTWLSYKGEEVSPYDCVDSFLDGPLIINIPRHNVKAASPRKGNKPQYHKHTHGPPGSTVQNPPGEGLHDAEQRPFENTKANNVSQHPNLGKRVTPLKTTSTFSSPVRNKLAAQTYTGLEVPLISPSLFPTVQQNANTVPFDGVGVSPCLTSEMQRGTCSGEAHRTRTPSERLSPSPKRSPDRVSRDSTSGTKNVDDIRANSEETAQQRQRHNPTSSPRPPAQGEVALRLMHPALKRVALISLPDASTLEDVLLAAVAKEPRLAGCKVIFRGKLLNDYNAKLSTCGIKACADNVGPVQLNPNADGVFTLYFAPNEPNGVQKTMLVEIETNLAIVERLIDQPGLTQNQRQGYYEELMRILFQTDGLQDLEDEWRARRKQLVKRVTELQDSLKVEEVM